MMWHDRQREVLSDKEWVALFFAVSVKFLFDLLEQFPLSLATAAHELSKYTVDASQTTYPGTVELADRLGIKHPKTSGSDATVEWVMSTDLLLVLRSPTGKFELLAVSIKTDEDFSKKRTKELLRLEREYWISRGVTWLLITPSLYDKRVGLRLRDSMPWALERFVSEDDLKVAQLLPPNCKDDHLHMCSKFSAQSLAALTTLSEPFGRRCGAEKFPWTLAEAGALISQSSC